MFTQVLEECVEGCGISLETFKKSRNYRSKLRHFRELGQKFPRESHLGAFLWAGPHVSTPLLHQHDFETAAAIARDHSTQWEFSPEVLAGVAALGQLIIKTTKNCLPDIMPKPSSVLRDGRSKIPTNTRKPTFPDQLASELGEYIFTSDEVEMISLHGIAKSWVAATKKRRREIGEILSNLFRSRSKITEAQDRADQPKERVLPGMYGRWIPGEENRANCLGKAQLVTGFADLAKAKTYYAIPLVDYDRLSSCTAAKIARDIVEVQYEWPEVLTPLSILSLIDMTSGIDNLDASPSLYHGIVIFKNRHNSWFLSDPNLHISGEIPESCNFTEKSQLIDAVSFVLPGFSYYLRDDRVYSNMEDYYGRALADCARALPETERILKESKTVEDIIQGLSRASFIHLVASRHQDIGDIPRDASARLKAICMLLDNAKDSDLKDTKVHSDLVHDRKMWFIYPINEESKLENMIVDFEDAKTLLQRLASSFCTRSIDFLRSRADRSFGGSRLSHPLVEIQDPSWGIGVSTLTHVALSMGLYEEVEQELLQHTFNDHLLCSAAGSALREDAKTSHLSAFAANTLCEMPFRSRSAEIILDALESSH